MGLHKIQFCLPLKVFIHRLVSWFYAKIYKYIYFHTHPFTIVSSSTGYFFIYSTFYIKKEEQEERERNLLLLLLLVYIWKGKKDCTFWQFMLRVLEHIIWMYCCCSCCVFSFNDSLIPYYAYLGSSSAYINDMYIWRYTLAKRVEIFPWIFTIDVAFCLRLLLYVRKYFIILLTIFLLFVLLIETQFFS